MPEPSPVPTSPPRTRLVSLDAFRGATVAAMVLVNNPGDWNAVYWPLDHARWNGWTPTDLVFPFFLFMVGVALAFSSRTRAPQALRRTAVIFGLGLFMAAYPRFDLATVRIPGVLARIALCYLAAWAVRHVCGARAQAAAAALLCLVYWLLLTRVPVPGVGGPSLEPSLDLGAWLDRTLLGPHLWRQSRTWDPEGVLSTLPAIATTLLGSVAGSWLRSARTGTRKTAGLLGAGIVLTLLGLAWDRSFPINKNLWTSSYVLFTGGLAAYLLGLAYWVVDVRGHAGWTAPFVAYGRNAILVFVGSGLLLKTLLLVHLPGPHGPVSLQGHAYRALFGSWLPPYPASFAHALVQVVGWGAVLLVLDRRRIYLTA